MNDHQTGLALHKEYEAKYSVPTTFYDVPQDATILPARVATLIGVLAIAVALTFVTVMV